MRKKYFSIGCLLILLVGIASCKRPNYSDTPAIELVSCERFNNLQGDSIVFKFKFKDGDGDVGLNDKDLPVEETRLVRNANGDTIFFNPEDPTQKFNCYEWNGSLSKIFRIETFQNYNNIFFEIDKKVNGNYVKVNNSCFPIDAYRFGRLAPENYVGPIDVNFTYTSTVALYTERDDLPSQLIGLVEKDIIRFRIRIRDRKQNISNEVVTQDIRVDGL